jgi:hypothetical protein
VRFSSFLLFSFPPGLVHGATAFALRGNIHRHSTFQKVKLLLHITLDFSQFYFHWISLCNYSFQEQQLICFCDVTNLDHSVLGSL